MGLKTPLLRKGFLTRKQLVLGKFILSAMTDDKGTNRQHLHSHVSYSMWNKLWKQELFNVIWDTKITLSLSPIPVNLCTMSRSHQLQLNIESIKKRHLKVSTQNLGEIRKRIRKICDYQDVAWWYLKWTWWFSEQTSTKCTKPNPWYSGRLGNIEVNHKGKAIHKKISVLGLKQ